VSLVPNKRSPLLTPDDPVSVELPPSPNPMNELNESTGGIPLPIIPPGTGGLLFSSIAALRNENSIETNAKYRAHLARDTA
jgi:hypothetical protein